MSNSWILREMNSFVIHKDLSIFVYGDNSQSRKLIVTLKKQRYNIKGIIDKKYKNTFVDKDATIYSNISFFNTADNKDNIFIIIALNNGIAHHSVALSFFELGIHKLLYLPITYKTLPMILFNEMCLLFNKTIESGLDAVKSIPYVDDYRFINDFGFKLINYDDGFVSFFCPTSLLFTLKMSDIKDQAFAKKYKIYSDKKISDYSPYFSLFEFLVGGRKECADEYLSFFRETECEKQELLDNRRVLFNQFEENLKYNFSFFLVSPASCYLDGTKIRVLDGYHRLVFLMLHKYYLVPIKLSVEDFSKLGEWLK